MIFFDKFVLIIFTIIFKGFNFGHMYYLCQEVICFGCTVTLYGHMALSAKVVVCCVHYSVVLYMYFTVSFLLFLLSWFVFVLSTVPALC